MKRLTLTLLVVGCVLNATANKIDQAVQMDQDVDFIMMSDEKHQSWCTVKAYWKYKWCNYKPKGARWQNGETAADAARACNITYQFDLSNCKARLLSKTSTPEQLMNEDCVFKAEALADACRLMGKMPERECEAQQLASVASCGRRLGGVKTTGAEGQKHKSWCTFRAWVGKQWRKKNRVFKSDVEKARQDALNNAQYNAEIAKCATRRLMREMEESFAKGNAHESWCSFKNRMRYIGCKSTAVFSLNADTRRANLAKCDTEYNTRKAVCDGTAIVQKVGL